MNKLVLTDCGQYIFSGDAVFKYADFDIKRDGGVWEIRFSSTMKTAPLATFEGTFIEASHALKLHLLTQRLLK